MKRFSKWCLMIKILAVEIATTVLFLLAVYALVRHEAAVMDLISVFLCAI